MSFYTEYVIKSSLTGSNYICNPPVTGTDIDTVLLVRPGYEDSLKSEGFCYYMSEHEYDSLGSFVSWRKGNQNYITTEVEDFYNKFVFATEIARLLNLKIKQDRVKLFQAILYNTWATENSS